MNPDDPRERFDVQRLSPAPVPIHVHYHKAEQAVELVYALSDLPDSNDEEHSASRHNGDSTFDEANPTAGYRVSVELLRVFSPSAEVRGHSPDQAVLQTGKKDVALRDIKSVGNYALKFIFDDGHDSGLYSWAYLYELARHKDDWWSYYLKALKKAGASRESLGIQIKQL